MNAVIIYDDRKVGARAYALLERAASRTGEASLWSVCLWQLDQLALPSTAAAALDQAVGAHLIVLALHYQGKSPTGLWGWLESWAGLRKVQDAALTLFDGEEGDTLSATAIPEMSESAQRHGLSLIPGDSSQTESATLGLGVLERDVLAVRRLRWTTDFPPGSRYRDFGINE